MPRDVLVVIKTSRIVVHLINDHLAKTRMGITVILLSREENQPRDSEF